MIKHCVEYLHTQKKSDSTIFKGFELYKSYGNNKQPILNLSDTTAGIIYDDYYNVDPKKYLLIGIKSNLDE